MYIFYLCFIRLYFHVLFGWLVGCLVGWLGLGRVGLGLVGVGLGKMLISLKENTNWLFLFIYVIFGCIIRFIRAGPGAQGVLDRN